VTDDRGKVAQRGTVLVVDDEAGVRASVRAILEETCDVLEAEDGTRALEVIGAHEVDLVMLDQRMPGEAGIDVLPRIKAVDPSTVVVIATAVRDLRTAVEALKRGAYDYLTKPFEVDDILMLAQRALEKRALEREVLGLRSALAGGGPDAGTPGAFAGMVGRHPEMVRIYQLVTQIAATPATVRSPLVSSMAIATSLNVMDGAFTVFGESWNATVLVPASTVPARWVHPPLPSIWIVSWRVSVPAGLLIVSPGRAPAPPAAASV